MSKKLNVVILAAGQGKRMNSNLPKVMHSVGDKPMLCRVLEAAFTLNPTKVIVVYGHGGEVVKRMTLEYFKTQGPMSRQRTRNTINKVADDERSDDYDHIVNKIDNILWIYQDQQLGTGHALRCAVGSLDDDAATILLYGDVPLISQQILQQLVESYQDNIVMLTANFTNPTGYGRILRDNAEATITGIIEEKDANPKQKQITEINSGIYVLPNTKLDAWLTNLSNDNAQGEYYITDIISMAHRDGVMINAVTLTDDRCYEIMGVNNKIQLEYLERRAQQLLVQQLLTAGATVMDKSRIDIRGVVTVGSDVLIDINCVFAGVVNLGDNVTIGAGCILNNVTVANNVTIKPYSVIEDALISDDCQIGPFARIRPGTKLNQKTHIGNFVEIKNSEIGESSKVNHLTYIGDAKVGAQVNIGAGSVTCNYDGKNKFKTTIEDNVFVGSGTMMVAPVKLGQGSIIGAGSTITKDTPENELTLERSRQVSVPGWVKKHRSQDD